MPTASQAHMVFGNVDHLPFVRLCHLFCADAVSGANWLCCAPGYVSPCHDLCVLVFLFVMFSLSSFVACAPCTYTHTYTHIHTTDDAFLGMTVLAIGASLPDTISMGVAAKSGHASMAGWFHSF